MGRRASLLWSPFRPAFGEPSLAAICVVPHSVFGTLPRALSLVNTGLVSIYRHSHYMVETWDFGAQSCLVGGGNKSLNVALTDLKSFFFFASMLIYDFCFSVAGI